MDEPQEIEYLRCNKCWNEIRGNAKITVCSHIFCGKCSKDFENERICPGCQDPLPRRNDIISVDPSVQSEESTIALFGLPPERIMTAASTAISFWDYQQKAILSYERHISDKSKTTAKAIEQQSQVHLTEYEETLKQQAEKSRKLSEDLSAKSKAIEEQQREITELRRQKYNLYELYEGLKREYDQMYRAKVSSPSPVIAASKAQSAIQTQNQNANPNQRIKHRVIPMNMNMSMRQIPSNSPVQAQNRGRVPPQRAQNGKFNWRDSPSASSSSAPISGPIVAMSPGNTGRDRHGHTMSIPIRSSGMGMNRSTIRVQGTANPPSSQSSLFSSSSTAIAQNSGINRKRDRPTVEGTPPHHDHHRQNAQNRSSTDVRSNQTQKRFFNWDHQQQQQRQRQRTGNGTEVVAMSRPPIRPVTPRVHTSINMRRDMSVPTA